jgi:predicted flap endonuclease-1-like 5' DNA nuclease
MSELLQTYWPLIVAALVVGLVIAWYVFSASRKTRVTSTSRDVLDEGAAPAERNKALIDSAPAATPMQPPAGVALAAGNLSGDDLTRIKGLGPKLAATLHGLDVTTFAQIAAWNDAEIDRIDANLGRFQGRIRRDDWVGQAKLLAAGDEAGFVDRYGKLS